MCIWIGPQRHRLALSSEIVVAVQTFRVESAMEGAAAQMAVPVLGIIAAAAVTFYTVSFMQLRDVHASCSLIRALSNFSPAQPRHI